MTPTGEFFEPRYVPNPRNWSQESVPLKKFSKILSIKTLCIAHCKIFEIKIMFHQNLNLSSFKRKKSNDRRSKTPTEKQFSAIKNSLIVERFEKSVQLVNWQRTRNRPYCPSVRCPPSPGPVRPQRTVLWIS